MKYTTINCYKNGRDYRSKIDFEKIDDARAYAIKSLKKNRYVQDVMIMRYSGERRKDGSLIDKTPIGYVTRSWKSNGERVWMYVVWNGQKNNSLIINKKVQLKNINVSMENGK